jgi:hypothetical protein
VGSALPGARCRESMISRNFSLLPAWPILHLDSVGERNHD